MAISLVGSGEAADGLNSSYTRTVTLPGGVAQDDVVYVLGVQRNLSDLNLVEDSGTYTELADVFGSDSNSINAAVYRKVQGATPDSTVTVRENTSSITGWMSVVALVLRGVDTTTPEDATTTTASGGNTGRADPPSITTVTANAWVLAFGASSQQLADPTTAPTGYGNVVGIGHPGIIVSTKEIATAGAENPGIYTDFTTSGLQSWAAATVAVRPAAGGGTTVGSGLTTGLKLKRLRLVA